MKIDIQEYILKIKSDTTADRAFFYDLTEALLCEIEKDKPFDFFEQYDQILNKFAKSYGIAKDSKAYEVGDVFFRSFHKYITGGIVALYIEAETCEWFPLPFFSQPIEKYRKKLVDMDTILTIYRGTHIDEFKSGKIRQSWSIDSAIACRFAFNSCRDSSEQFDIKNRVVLQANIHKNDVFLYLDDDLDGEKECIIDVTKILKDSMSVFVKYHKTHDDNINDYYDCEKHFAPLSL